MSLSPEKAAAGRAAAALVADGMVVGLGTGSTAEAMLGALAERIAAEGLRVQGVPTSEATAETARSLGIPLHPDYPERLANDLTLDGADEVDPRGQLVKGGGGALLREKLVARAASRLVIMVDPSKHVEHLGPGFPIPVEIVPFGWKETVARLESLGATPRLRMAGGQPYRTDGGHYIADCSFPVINDPAVLELRLKSALGVVETGLFVDMADQVLTGRPDGTCDVKNFP